MGMLRRLFALGQKEYTPELLSAIEHAVSRVEPLLKQTGRYPAAYQKSVMNALEYAHSLALSIPGPIAVDLDSYASDAYVHAIFPSLDHIAEAFRTSIAMQNYLRKDNTGEEVYALMGMRRIEKTMMGMELSGQLIQQDVPQHAVYFISHTIENPAPSEKLARDQMAWRFFDSLIGKVEKRVALRKQEMQSQRQEMDLLIASLRAANIQTRPALEAELSEMMTRMSCTASSLNLINYLDDFETVLLNPEQSLRLNHSSMSLDSMGIQRDDNETTQGKTLIFDELIGFDRRNWIVTMVHFRNIQRETFTARLDTTYRMLSI